MSVFGFEYPQSNSDYATELLIISKEVPENQNLYMEVILTECVALNHWWIFCLQCH
jgi:hypothetical protein